MRKILEEHPEGMTIPELMQKTGKSFKVVKEELARLPTESDGRIFYLVFSPEHRLQLQQKIQHKISTKTKDKDKIVSKSMSQQSKHQPTPPEEIGRLLSAEQIFQAVWAGEKLQCLNTAGRWITYSVTDIKRIKNETRPVRKALPVRCIAGIQIVIGMEDPPAQDQQYYTPALHPNMMYDIRKWTGSDTDQQYLAWGMVHWTADNAIAHAKALLRASGNIVS